MSCSAMQNSFMYTQHVCPHLMKACCSSENVTMTSGIMSLITRPSQPSPKRARQETAAEEEYSRYIQTAESALKALQALNEGRDNTTAPPWLEPRLQELQTLIAHISTATHTT